MTTTEIETTNAALPPVRVEAVVGFDGVSRGGVRTTHTPGSCDTCENYHKMTWKRGPCGWCGRTPLSSNWVPKDKSNAPLERSERSDDTLRGVVRP